MLKFEITVQCVTSYGMPTWVLNGGKASGPNELPNLNLKNAANEMYLFFELLSINFYRGANYQMIG